MGLVFGRRKRLGHPSRGAAISHIRRLGWLGPGISRSISIFSQRFFLLILSLSVVLALRSIMLWKPHLRAQSRGWRFVPLPSYDFRWRFPQTFHRRKALHQNLTTPNSLRATFNKCRGDVQLKPYDLVDILPQSMRYEFACHRC